MQPYALRTSKLKPLRAVINAVESSRCVPVIIVVCGALNPIHNGHVALYDNAEAALTSPSVRDSFTGRPYLVLGGYVSPVGDLYDKPGLLPFSQRVEVAEAAVKGHPAIEVDCWEGLQPTYVRTYYVLKHLQEAVQAWYDSQETEDKHSVGGRGVSVRVIFACGTDLFRSFFKPGCWRLDLLQKLLEMFQVVVITRPESSFDRNNEGSGASLANFVTLEDGPAKGKEVGAGKPAHMLPKNYVLTQVINGKSYTVDFSKYQFIYKQPISVINASSTAIRAALEAAVAAAKRHDSAAEQVARREIADMVPEAALDLITRHYSLLLCRQ